MGGARLLFAAAMVAGGLLAPAARADVLSLGDRSTLSVRTGGVEDRLGRGLVPSNATETRWTHRDASGLVLASGCLAGSRSVLGLADEASLSRDPVTGEVFALEARNSVVGGHLALHSWTGGDFLDPIVLAATAGPVARTPRLAHAPDGTAVVAWMTGSSRPSEATSLRLQGVMLSPRGTEEIVFFVEIPRPGDWLEIVGPGVELAEGASHVAIDEASERAWVFLGEPEGDGLAAFGARLAILEDIWGGSAAPVPVTLAPMGGPEPLSADEDGPADERVGEAGAWALELVRLPVQGWDAYAWRDGDLLRAVAFRDGRASPVVAVSAESPSAERSLVRALSRAIADSDGPLRGSEAGRRLVAR